MLTFELFALVAAIVVASASFLKARRVSRRLERLSESYWELRYEYGQLRARLNRMEGTDSASATEPVVPPSPGSFVPLSSLKK